MNNLRDRLLKPWNFKAYLWAKMPLAACAGLKLRGLDEQSCTVALPGGWRTQNPFGSTYFAAQAMAAELSTGAPAFVLARSASLSMMLREVRGVFLKRIQGEAHFTFSDVAGMKEVVDRSAVGGDGEFYTGRSVGRTLNGDIAAEFDITWSFKRRG